MTKRPLDGRAARADRQRRHAAAAPVPVVTTLHTLLPRRSPRCGTCQEYTDEELGRMWALFLHGVSADRLHDEHGFDRTAARSLARHLAHWAGYYDELSIRTLQAQIDGVVADARGAGEVGAGGAKVALLRLVRTFGRLSEKEMAMLPIAHRLTLVRDLSRALIDAGRTEQEIDAAIEQRADRLVDADLLALQRHDAELYRGVMEFLTRRRAERQAQRLTAGAAP